MLCVSQYVGWISAKYEISWIVLCGCVCVCVCVCVCLDAPCEPCGAVRHKQGLPRTPAKCIAAITPELIVRFIKFWFYTFKQF